MIPFTGIDAPNFSPSDTLDHFAFRLPFTRRIRTGADVADAMRSYRKGDPWLAAFSFYGSAIPRSVVPALLSAAISAAIEHTPGVQVGGPMGGPGPSLAVSRTQTAAAAAERSTRRSHMGPGSKPAC